jgi:hypothetical protein
MDQRKLRAGKWRSNVGVAGLSLPRDGQADLGRNGSVVLYISLQELIMLNLQIYIKLSVVKKQTTKVSAHTNLTYIHHLETQPNCIPT